MKVSDIFHLSDLPEPKFKAIQANKMVNLNPVETSLVCMQEFTAILEKKTREAAEKKLTFQNFKRATVGRQAAENVLRTDGGVIAGAKEAVTELDCFTLFMDPTVIRDITERTNSNITKHLDSLTAD